MIEKHRNGYVKWPFLIATSVSLLGVMVTIAIWGASQVVANDRIRASEDIRILEKVERLLQENALDHRTIMGDLREMKAKMGISEHGLRV